MADTVFVTSTPGAPYTWQTATFAWDSPSGGKTWATATPFVYDMDVDVSLALSDARTSQAQKSITESLSVADTLARSFGKNLNETLSFAETYADLIAYVLHFVESLSFAEALNRDAAKGISESLSIGELLSKDSSKSLEDSFSLADAVSKDQGKAIAETLGITDAARKQVGKALEDSFGLSDGLTRSFGKGINESLSFAETYTDLIAYVLHFVENLGFAEVLGKDVTRPIEEAFGIADQATKSTVKNITEAVAFAEAFGRTVAYRRNIAEGFSVAESLGKAYELAFDEALSIAEQYRRRANGVISDVIASGEAITEQDFADILDAGHAPGYTNFRDFIPGDYVYERAIFRAIVESTNSDRGFVDALSVAVDVPDIFDRGSAAVTDANAGVTVYFSRTFRIVPDLSLTIKGGISNTAVPRILSVSETAFTAILEHSNGQKSTGSFTWVAQGY